MSMTRAVVLVLALLPLGSQVVAEEPPAPKHRVLVELFASQG